MKNQKIGTDKNSGAGIAAIAIIMFFIIGIFKMADYQSPKFDQLSRISSFELISNYYDNEVIASNQYKERRLLISGKVKHITLDIFGNAHVTICEDSFYIDIDFKFKDKNDVKFLHRGDLVSIEGVVSDMIINTIMITDCKIW